MMTGNPMQILVIITVGVASFCGGYLISGTSSTEAKDAADIAAEVTRLSISDTASSPNTISDNRGFFQKLWDSLKSFFYPDGGSSTTTPAETLDSTTPAETLESIHRKRELEFEKFVNLHKEEGDIIDIARANFRELEYRILDHCGWEERKDELPERPYFKEDLIAFDKRDEAEAAAKAAAEARRAAEVATEVAAKAVAEAVAEAVTEAAEAARKSALRWNHRT
jgi:hypothetical protein